MGSVKHVRDQGTPILSGPSISRNVIGRFDFSQHTAGSWPFGMVPTHFNQHDGLSCLRLLAWVQAMNGQGHVFLPTMHSRDMDWHTMPGLEETWHKRKPCCYSKKMFWHEEIWLVWHNFLSKTKPHSSQLTSIFLLVLQTPLPMPQHMDAPDHEPRMSRWVRGSQQSLFISCRLHKDRHENCSEVVLYVFETNFQPAWEFDVCKKNSSLWA